MPEDSAAFEQFVKIANRKSGKELSFANDGAIITEKLAMNMKLSVGDTLSIALVDGVSKDVKISGIMENYVGHYVYMTPAYYKQLSQQRNVSNALYIKMNKVNDKNESTLGNRCLLYTSLMLCIYTGCLCGNEVAFDNLIHLRTNIFPIALHKGIITLRWQINMQNIHRRTMFV